MSDIQIYKFMGTCSRRLVNSFILHINQLPAVSCKSVQQPFKLKWEHMSTSGCTCLHFRLHHLLVISQQIHTWKWRQAVVDRPQPKNNNICVYGSYNITSLHPKYDLLYSTLSLWQSWGLPGLRWRDWQATLLEVAQATSCVIIQW